MQLLCAEVTLQSSCAPTPAVAQLTLVYAVCLLCHATHGTTNYSISLCCIAPFLYLLVEGSNHNICTSLKLWPPLWTLLHAGITLVLMPWVPLPRRWPLQAVHAIPYCIISATTGRGRGGRPSKEGGKTTQAGLCTHPSSIRHPTVIHCKALTQKHFITSGLRPMLIC